MASAPIHRIDEWKLRKLFNETVLPRIEAKEVLETIVSEGLANPQYGQPPGTVSQMVAYWEVDDGVFTQIARAHRYVRPDGMLGGSGRHLPDPKEMLHEGKILKPRRKQA
jgi:hypothetical protein